MADAFSYFLPDGTPVNGSTVAPQAGTPFYQSEALTADANGNFTSTAQGDAANAFRGFTSADGGSFGDSNGLPADLKTAQGRFGALTGLEANDPRLGDLSKLDAQGYNDLGSSFAGIAQGRKGALEAGLASANPMLQRTALAYQRGNGSAGVTDAEYNAWKTESAVPTPNKVRPVPTQPASDPFGAFPDMPTAPNEEPAVPFGKPPLQTPATPPFGPVMPASAAQPSGGMMAPGGGSAARATMTGGRFGAMGQPSPFAQKFRQRFKPLGAPTNGFTPQSSNTPQTPSTNVF